MIEFQRRDGWGQKQGGRVGLEHPSYPRKLKQRWYGCRKELLLPVCVKVGSRIEGSVTNIFLIRKDRGYYLPRHTYCDTK